MSRERRKDQGTHLGRIVLPHVSKGPAELSVLKWDVVKMPHGHGATQRGRGGRAGWTFCVIHAAASTTGLVRKRKTSAGDSGIVPSPCIKCSSSKHTKKPHRRRLLDHPRGLSILKHLHLAARGLIQQLRVSRFVSFKCEKARRGRGVAGPLPVHIRQRNQDNQPYIQSRLRLLNMKELLQTEEWYSNALGFCVVNYLSPLEANPEIVSKEDVRKVFSNMRVLHNISDQFLRDLKLGFSQMPKFGIGKVFQAIAPFFKLYKIYIFNYEVATRTVERLEKTNRSFLGIVQEARRKSSLPTAPYCRNYKLRDFLVCPISRLPRYRMLMANVARLTSVRHPEYQSDAAALAVMTEVSQSINAAFRSTREREREGELNKVPLVPKFAPTKDIGKSRKTRFAYMQEQVPISCTCYRVQLFPSEKLMAVWPSLLIK